MRRRIKSDVEKAHSGQSATREIDRLFFGDEFREVREHGLYAGEYHRADAARVSPELRTWTTRGYTACSFHARTEIASAVHHQCGCVDGK